MQDGNEMMVGEMVLTMQKKPMTSH